MANTEGMSDEFVQSLATVATATAAATATTANERQRQRQRRRFQQRMDMPIGDTPAATVVRVSRSQKQNQQQFSSLSSSSRTSTSDNGPGNNGADATSGARMKTTTTTTGAARTVRFNNDNDNDNCGDVEDEDDEKGISNTATAEHSTTMASMNLPTLIVGDIQERHNPRNVIKKKKKKKTTTTTTTNQVMNGSMNVNANMNMNPTGTSTPWMSGQTGKTTTMTTTSVEKHQRSTSSRFSSSHHHQQQQDQNQKSNYNGSSNDSQNTISSSTMTATGFPSVHVPMGTFVNNSSSSSSNHESSLKNISKVGSRSNGEKKMAMINDHRGWEDSSPGIGVTAAKEDTAASNNKPAVADVAAFASKHSTSSSTSGDNIYEASRHDADVMLSNLSLEEIQRYQREITSSLSPDLVEFLKNKNSKKKRRQQRQGSSGNHSESGQDSGGNDDGNQGDVDEHRNRHGDSAGSTEKKEMTYNDPIYQIGQKSSPIRTTTTTTNTATKGEKERREKERIANLIASVKTYEDLDKVYQMEMHQPHPLDNDKKNSRSFTTSHNSNSSSTSGAGGLGVVKSTTTATRIIGEDQNFSSNDDDKINDMNETFDVACDLLRSTSPRQVLWAVRTVSQELSSMVAANRKNSQYGRNGNDDVDVDASAAAGDANHHLHPPTTTTTTTVTSTARKLSSVPMMLPVSLRCLLDKPVVDRSSIGSYLLHTYALQALHSLSILTCQSIEGSHTNVCDEEVYQLYFMDDAVPTPSMEDMYTPVNVEPLATNGGVDGSSGNGGTTTTSSNVTGAGATAYATSSSSTSAMSDATQFQRDPMWTLLSKMKILPRLSFFVTEFDIPVEAWVAICGLLALVGRRSPGAASAIIQHEEFVPNIHRFMLRELHNRTPQQKHEGESGVRHGGQNNIGSSNNSINNNIKMTKAAMQLFCTLARQSKVVVLSLPLEDILPPLLALETISEYDFECQQLALVLWRTSMRYGIGLPALESMLKFSARSFALAVPSDSNVAYDSTFDLSSDYISAFTEVVECSRLIGSKSPVSISAAIDQKKLNGDVLAVTETNAKYLPSILSHLMIWISQAICVDNGRPAKESASCYKSNGSRLLFLSSWINWIVMAEKATGAAMTSPPDLTDEAQSSLLQMLHIWIEKDYHIENIWKSLLLRFFACSAASSQSEESIDETVEATGCMFLKGFFAVVAALSQCKSKCDRVRDLKRSLDQKIVQLILLTSQSIFDNKEEVVSIQRAATVMDQVDLVRNGWLIQGYSSVSKYLLQAIANGGISSSAGLTIVRSVVFQLLGYLQRGHESIAAILFSPDVLFETNNDPLVDSIEARNSNRVSSPISSLFFNELCSGEKERAQLDHSFKLHHGFGITSHGFGPFGLESLLSTTDLRPSAPLSAGDESTKDDAAFLPQDRMWLWQSMSGSIRVNTGNVGKGTREAIEVIKAVLDLLLELDQGEEVMGITGYSRSLPIGSKLYYVMNVCLQPEDIIRDESIGAAVEALVRRYLYRFGRYQDDGVVFCGECFKHSDPAKFKKDEDRPDRETNQKGQENENRDMEDEKILEDYVNRGPGSSDGKASNGVVSSSELRAMEAFVEDMCTSYRDYGAQYSCFTHCMMVLLVPTFPDTIRRRVLQELEGMLHLLTLPAVDTVTSLIEKSILGGLPDLDQSQRDSPVILDAVTSAIVRSETLSCPLQGYILQLSVALLSRSIAICVAANDEATLSVNKRRLYRFTPNMVLLICDVTEKFLDGGGSKEALLDATIESVTDRSDYVGGDTTNVTVDSRFIDARLNRFMHSKTNP